MRVVPLTVAAVTIWCLLVSAATAQLAHPKVDTAGSKVVRVMNPGPVAWADSNGWKLVLERTIQPKEGEPGELQKPSTVVRSSRGQFVVSDYNAPSVALFGVDGRFIKFIGRSGTGPGEYKSPFVALYRDTIVIHDPSVSRVTLTTIDGKLLRSFSAFSNSIGFGIDIDAAGRIQIPVFNGTGQQWNFYSLSGDALDSIRLPLAAPVQKWIYSTGRGKGSMSIPFASHTAYRLLRDGSILYGSTGRYQILRSRTGRDTLRMFGRTGVTGVPVPQQFRHSMFERMTGNPSIKSVAKLSDIPTSYPLWESLHEDSSGNISFLGDRVAVIDSDADDLPRIRIYRIDRRGK